MKILDKEYILENRVDYNSLDYDLIYAKEIDPYMDDAGFMGLTYEMYSSGDLRWYGYYKDGFSHGESFIINGCLKSYKIMGFGSVNRVYKEWDENGNLILWGEARLGIRLRYKKMDSQGNILNEKGADTERSGND